MLGCWLPQRVCNWNVFLIHHSPGKSGVLEGAVEYLQKGNGSSSFVRVFPHSENTFLCLSDTVCSIFSVAMCSRYQHPNILDLFCCFSDEGRYCLVHPYLPKGSLSDRLHHQVESSFIYICRPAAIVRFRLFTKPGQNTCQVLLSVSENRKCTVVLLLQNLTKALIMTR